MDRPANPACEVVLAHSSDLHVDEDRNLASGGGDGTAGLCRVLATARALPVDIVLLAGDTFESNQLGPAVLEGARRLLAEAGMPVVILPGNHDRDTAQLLSGSLMDYAMPRADILPLFQPRSAKCRR